MDEKRPEEMTFEESLDRLNELVELLEGGTLDLNGSIEVYEQAVALRDSRVMRHSLPAVILYVAAKLIRKPGTKERIELIV